MAALVICAVPAGDQCSEVAVIVGKHHAVVLPFASTPGTDAVDRTADAVRLALFEGEAKPTGVQTTASASNDKADENGEEGAADESRSRHTVASATFSCNGQLLAVCGDGRHVTVFCTQSWTKVHQWAAKRRVCTLRFSSRGEDLLLADKTGDVYRFQCRDGFTETGELILGHISVLLDFGMSLDNRHIFTCDRDDKLRVSRYPNAYNIEAFCLGHTQFVTCLATTSKFPDSLFSGAGDGSVIMWQYRSGSLLSKLELSEKQPVCALAASSAGTVAIAQEKSSKVHIASVEGDCLRVQQSVAVRGAVVSVAFSRSGDLWVITTDPQQPVQILSVPLQGKAEYPVVQSLLQQSLAESAPLLEGRLHSRLDMAMLDKDPMDGMHRYFERKQERLQGGSTAAVAAK